MYRTQPSLPVSCGVWFPVPHVHVWSCITNHSSRRRVSAPVCCCGSAARSLLSSVLCCCIEFQSAIAFWSYPLAYHAFVFGCTLHMMLAHFTFPFLSFGVFPHHGQHNKLTGANVCPASPFSCVVGSLISLVSLWPRLRAAVAQFGRSASYRVAASRAVLVSVIAQPSVVAGGNCSRPLPQQPQDRRTRRLSQ